MKPRDKQKGKTLWDLLDTRRVPFRETIHTLRSQFPTEHNERWSSDVLVLRGLEPLVLSMTEPLFVRPVSMTVEDLPPRWFHGAVDVHDSTQENFDLARRELTALLGEDGRSAKSYSQDDVLRWRWDLVHGLVEIEATLRLASPFEDRNRSRLSRVLFPISAELGPSHCHVRIEPDWVPVLNDDERAAVDSFEPFRLQADPFPRHEPFSPIEFGMRRYSILSGAVPTGIGLSADGSMFVNTTREDRVVLLPVERLINVRVYDYYGERGGSNSSVSLSVEHPNGYESHKIHEARPGSLDEYAEELAKLLGLEVEKTTRDERFRPSGAVE